jgi:thioredoxin reductase (NADPH)
MGQPIIVLVDDDDTSMGTLENAVGRRYGADYQIVAEGSTRAALDRIQKLVEAGERLALVMADQWMPVMTGIELLAKVGDIDWRVKRVLMLEVGDRADEPHLLQAIAQGKVDSYLGRPWGSPEFRLYPVIGELLSEWAKIDRSEAGWVRVVGEETSPRSVEVRDLLSRNSVPYEFYDAATDAGKQLLKEAGRDGSHLPVFVLFDGRVLVDPSNAEAAAAIGATTKPKPDVYDVAIIGSGPAGLAAAVYGASEGLHAVVIEPEAAGGQAGTTSLIRNYLGFPRGVSGKELTARAYEQAFLFGADFVFMNRAVGLTVRDDLRVVRLATGDDVVARSVVIASGVSYRRLGIENVERLHGAGVYYGAAVTEAPAMTDRSVFIVGGANSAGQAAVYLAKYAKDVSMVVRGSGLSSTMSDYLVKEIEQARNIGVRANTEVVDAYGDRRLDGLLLRHRASGSTERVAAEGLFLMIGAEPRTDWLQGVIERDERGFLLAGTDLPNDGRSAKSWGLSRLPFLLETSLPGVFAAGDVRHGAVQRVASAVGEGAIAIMLVHKYLAGKVQISVA